MLIEKKKSIPTKFSTHHAEARNKQQRHKLHGLSHKTNIRAGYNTCFHDPRVGRVVCF